MLRAGQPVTTVSEMVGHHSPAMTYGVYGHVIPGTGRQAAERLQDVLRAARGEAI
jgi:integrase